MKNSNVKKINVAGLIGYIISIILIVCVIIGTAAIGICLAGAIAISDNDVNVKIATNINVNSTGDILKELAPYISFDGIEDLKDLTDNNVEISDSDISELSVKEEDGGIIIDAKTNEINISMKKIIIALASAFIYLLAVSITLHMVKALMKALKNCETPFLAGVVIKMNHFAISLVCTVVIKIICSGFWSNLTTGFSYKVNIDLANILLVAVIYILTVVFKHGSGLQKEIDETL